MFKKIKKNPYYYCFKPKYSQHNDKSREREGIIDLFSCQSSKLFTKVWQKYKSFTLDKCTIIDFTNYLGVSESHWNTDSLRDHPLSTYFLLYKIFRWSDYMWKVPNCHRNDQNLVFLSLDDVSILVHKILELNGNHNMRKS